MEKAVMNEKSVRERLLFSNSDLKKLIVPLVIEQVLGVTIGMADTMMVAGVGEASVSGISLVDQLNILLIQVFGAMATGGAVVASQYLGRKDRENASGAAKQLVYACFFIAAFMSAFAISLNGVLLRWIYGAVDPDVMEAAKTYFWLSALSYPMLGVYNAGASLFRAMSDSKLSMKVSIVMNCINVGGNALLIYVFRMGVAGAAIASLVSRTVGAVVMMVRLCNKKNLITVEHFFRYRPDFAMIKRILHIGVPNGLENGSFQIGKVLVASLISGFGTYQITANAIGNNLATFETIPGSAIGMAMITVIGRCVGAGDYEQARYYAKKLMKIAYIAMASLCVVIGALSYPIALLYQPSQETLREAVWLGIYHSVCGAVIWPAAFALPNILRAAGDVRFTMLTSLISMWVCRIAASYVLALWLNLQIRGVWIAMTMDWLVRAVIFFGRYRSGKWEKNKVLE